jgi:CubicO group peptidase (beta-lactamase class C family)
MRNPLLIRLAILIFIGVAGINSSVGQSKQIKKIDAYVEQSRELWNIPGMAVAIVKDGEVILSKGYGVKHIDRNEAVDENTLFVIASNTKAFTSAALATLVDQKQISWDDKVQDYLPYFQLYDPYVSANMTVRDLLCHRSGLATFSGDLIWYGTKYSREEIIRRARFLKPAYGFREHFGYQNIMFLAAGEIIPEVTGMSWDIYIDSTFFKPLGMNSSTTSLFGLTQRTNFAHPHNDHDGTNKAIQFVNWDNISPAGGIFSSVADMSKWLKLQLGRGTMDSTTIWSEQRSREMWSVHTPEYVSPWSERNFPSKSFVGYGLGWELNNYHGRKIVSHGGGYDGMISKTVMVPEENLGFVILTNNINWLPSALTYSILDELLDGDEDKDWAAYFLELKQGMDEDDKKAKVEAEEARVKDSTPTLSLDSYAGTYTGELYGDCVVRLIGDQLAFQFEPTQLFRGTLRHWHYDTFELNWSSEMMLPSGMVQFIVGVDGEVEEMKVDVPNPDFDFTELEFKRVE